MSGATALARARQAGVVVTLDGDRLALSATRPAPKDLLDLLRAYKAEIIELLRCQDRPAGQVDGTGRNIQPLSPHARAHTCKGEPPGPRPVPSTFAGVRLAPAGDVALGPDDPGDDGLEWAGEVEDVPPATSERDWYRPKPLPAGSLVARLVAVGATINTYGKRASVRAPAGIPAELVHEVQARGWAIIPGGKPNPEAEQDSWLAGVPIAELEP